MSITIKDLLYQSFLLEVTHGIQIQTFIRKPLGSGQSNFHSLIIICTVEVSIITVSLIVIDSW